MSRSQLDPLPQAGQASGCVAIIPARGGSRGVPRKNLQAVGGRSLLERSVECALAADAVDSVWVSTDDAEIATLARRCGAEVIMRPEALASATASSESALQHALEALAERAVHPRLLVMLQCTAPFTTAADVDGAIAKLETEDADSCFTAVADHQFLWRQDNGHAVGINHDGRTRVRRQEMPPQFRENGGVYVVRTEAFVREQTRFCGRTVLCVTDAERSIEIDSPADLIQADALAQHLDRGTALEQLPPNPAAVIFDFDGVFTDGGVFVDEHGAESVRCDRSDGLGLSALRQHQIPVLVLSKERNPVVSVRTQKLGLEALHGIDDKLSTLQRWMQTRGIDWERAVFVGNDVNDVACMRAVGCAVCPADAYPEARRVAQIRLQKRGGRGAVREICDLLAQRLS